MDADQMQLIGMAIASRIVTVIPRQTAGIGQGFYLRAIGIRFTVELELSRRIFLTQLRMPVRFPSPHRKQAPVGQEANQQTPLRAMGHEL
jgi:hypothetical protein